MTELQTAWQDSKSACPLAARIDAKPRMTFILKTANDAERVEQARHLKRENVIGIHQVGVKSDGPEDTERGVALDT